jgi:tetratricopeptide (TPR) repeat protein
MAALLCGGTMMAQADRHHDPEAAAKEKEAREHYNKGMTHFDLGEIDAAVEEFRTAYSITQAPGLLFNIAQAYRYKKDYKQALHFYHSYLRLMPRAPNRTDVEARVAEMEELVKEQERLEKEKPVGVIPPPAHPDEPAQQTSEPTPAPAPAPEPPPRPRFLQTTGGKVTVALAVLTGVAAIIAAGLGASALSARDEYRAGCTAGACNDSTYDRAHSLALGTDVLIGIAGASAIAALAVGLTTNAAIKRPQVRAQAGGLAVVF